MTDLSVIVPLYNEEDSVVPLCDAIVGALDPLEETFEVLLVDDGSRDATVTRTLGRIADDPRLKLVKLRRNCGQTPAMAAGIDLAEGRILVTMDGDLQNDPRDIPDFLAKLDEGYDIVVGWRVKRQDKLITRKIPSRIANWLIGKVTGVPIRDNGCSLKAYRAHVIKQVPLYSEMHRFIPAMAVTTGARIAEIPVRHHARQFGESKYGLSRIWRVLMDLLTIKTITSFASQPLRWFALLAMPSLLITMLMLSAALVGLAGPDTHGVVPLAGSAMAWAALSAFLMFGGVLAELVSRTGDDDHRRAPLVTAQVVAPSGVSDGKDNPNPRRVS